MKFNISKEWCTKMAELEEGQEITVGVPYENIDRWIEERKKQGLVDIKLTPIYGDVSVSKEEVLDELDSMVGAMLRGEYTTLDFNDSYRDKVSLDEIKDIE